MCNVFDQTSCARWTIGHIAIDDWTDCSGRGDVSYWTVGSLSVCVRADVFAVFSMDCAYNRFSVAAPNFWVNIEASKPRDNRTATTPLPILTSGFDELARTIFGLFPKCSDWSTPDPVIHMPRAPERITTQITN